LDGSPTKSPNRWVIVATAIFMQIAHSPLIVCPPPPHSGGPVNGVNLPTDEKGTRKTKTVFLRTVTGTCAKKRFLLCWARCFCVRTWR
jgi:hypothetical protein